MRTLIITGYGINCEKEMALAVHKAGSEVEVQHFHTLMSEPSILHTFDWLIIPGGFSFGDELGGGKVFANRILHSDLKQHLEEFVGSGKAILGICNGFQILTKLGLLPFGDESCVSLGPNASDVFENRWVHHTLPPSRCMLTEGLTQLTLPIRHAEGRFVAAPGIRKKLFEQGQVVLQYADESFSATETYPQNPNGSTDGIAGICDETGRILGMMAHPEAFLSSWHHPHQSRLKWQGAPLPPPDGLTFFQTAVKALSMEKSLCH